MSRRGHLNKITPGVGAGGARFEIIEVPNSLAEKAGSFRADRIEAAAIAADIAKLAERYPDLVRKDIERLGPLWEAASAAEPDAAAEEELQRITHDLSGQSASFGYELVAAIAGGLQMLVEGGASRRERARRAVRAHIAALEQTVRHGIMGDGGDAGRQILQSLHTAVLHCVPREPAA